MSAHAVQQLETQSALPKLGQDVKISESVPARKFVETQLSRSESTFATLLEAACSVVSDSSVVMLDVPLRVLLCIL